MIQIIPLSALAFWPWNWLGFTLPKALILSLGLGVFFLAWAVRGQIMSLRGRELWPVWAYFGLLIVYTFFSSSSLSSLLGLSAGQWGLMTQMLYLGVFLVALNAHPVGVADLRPLRGGGAWGKPLLWLNIIVGGYALIQFIGLDPLQGFWQEEAFLNRSFSFLGNPNWLASFLVLTFPVVFYQRPFVETRLIASLQMGGLTLLNLLALLTTASKAGFLAALFLTVVMLKDQTKHWKKWIIALGILMIVGLAYFYNDGWALTRSLGSRVHIWSGAWQAFLAQPWGYGLDTFWTVFPSFSGPELWTTEGLNTMITHPHNFILEKLLDIGPWGLLLFLWMVFVPIKNAWQKNDERRWIAYGLMAYLITLLFGFETIGTGIIFWLFLGSLFYKKSKKAPIPSPTSQRLGIGGLGVIFLLISVIHLQHARANAFYEQGRTEMKQAHIAAALMDFEKAIQIYPYDRIYLLQSTELLLALQSEDEKYLDQAEAHLDQMEKISHGKDPELPLFSAWLAAKRADLQEFESNLERAFLVNPASGNNYKIGLHLFQELGWEEEYEKLKKLFYENLPEFWNEPETTPGRIFQKNHPWVMSI